MSRTEETILDNEKLQWAVVLVAASVVIGGCGYAIYKILPMI